MKRLHYAVQWINCKITFSWSQIRIQAEVEKSLLHRNLNLVTIDSKVVVPICRVILKGKAIDKAWIRTQVFRTLLYHSSHHSCTKMYKNVWVYFIQQRINKGTNIALKEVGIVWAGKKIVRAFMTLYLSLSSFWSKHFCVSLAKYDCIQRRVVFHHRRRRWRHWRRCRRCRCQTLEKVQIAESETNYRQKFWSPGLGRNKNSAKVWELHPMLLWWWSSAEVCFVVLACH